MKILLLAPHPFYQERGTPIAVNLLLKALSERGDKIDVLTYHIGADTVHANVAIHRIARIPFVKSVRPGFSFKKIVCDIFADELQPGERLADAVNRIGIENQRCADYA